MLATDEDALICDMAETYHVLNVESLPIITYATLACGLRSNSRIKSELAGYGVPFDTYLLACIVDGIRWLQWSKTEAAAKHRKPPDRLADLLVTKPKATKNKDTITFAAPEEYLAARAKLIKEVDADGN